MLFASSVSNNALRDMNESFPETGDAIESVFINSLLPTGGLKKNMAKFHNSDICIELFGFLTSRPLWAMDIAYTWMYKLFILFYWMLMYNLTP